MNKDIILNQLNQAKQTDIILLYCYPKAMSFIKKYITYAVDDADNVLIIENKKPFKSSKLIKKYFIDYNEISAVVIESMEV